MIVWFYSIYGKNEDVYYKPMLKNIQIAIKLNIKIIIATTDIYENDIKSFFRSFLEFIQIRVYPSEIFKGYETFLRFLAIENIYAEFYFIKDSDSIVTEREISIMNNWITFSKEPYLIIRDNPLHIAPILSGMFGFRRSEQEIFIKKCRHFIKNHHGPYRYGLDQLWLAEQIYPSISKKVQVYSSYFYFREENLIRINRSINGERFIGAQAKENINPNSMYAYFECFYGEKLLSLPFISNLPQGLSRLLYGRVRPSLYLAILLKSLQSLYRLC